jgi:hypothetical protein
MIEDLYLFVQYNSQIWLNPLRGWLPLWLQTKTPFFLKIDSGEREPRELADLMRFQNFSFFHENPVLEIIAGK